MNQVVPTKRVLVVDDEEDLQTLLGHVLWDHGYEVEFASTAKAALQRAELGGLDLVILDLMLPDMDGHLLLERLRALPGACPMIVLSVRADYTSFERALRLGAEAYLVKPFRLRELLAACRSAIEGPHARPGERRRETRYAVEAEVRVLARDGTPITLGRLIDLSSSGAKVRLGAPLRPQDGVQIVLETTRGPALGLEGRVAWQGVAARGFAHGLGFVNLTPENEVRLRDLIGPGA